MLYNDIIILVINQEISLKSRNIMSLPNKITIIRLILVPFVILFFLLDRQILGFVPYGILIALILFIIGATTDFLDGYIARKYNMITNLGKLLDPMADKLLAHSALVIMSVLSLMANILPIWTVVIVLFINLGRDTTVDAIRYIGASRNKVIAANITGKLRTIFGMPASALMLLMGFLHFYSPAFAITNTYNLLLLLSYIILAIATIICAVSWYFYLFDNKDVFKEEAK